jgi:hypothetical protein
MAASTLPCAEGDLSNELDVSLRQEQSRRQANMHGLCSAPIRKPTLWPASPISSISPTTSAELHSGATCTHPTFVSAALRSTAWWPDMQDV